ncbi:MAG: DUF2461 domain-containing protein [Candidatus Pelethousia sp.]|nr:DUF2461 domain-containing protein [Candidatus Pelethousia sp.]
MEQAFQGFNEDTYKFLIELAFNNNKAFFEANRGRYRQNVQEPLRALAEALLPTALSIDPAFNPRMTSVLSRIYRDTRFSRDKSPYRNHAWLAFRRPGHRLSESFVLYFEITPQGYGYGLGMYESNLEMMNGLRRRILADPAGFLSYAQAPSLAKFALDGQPYKRDKVPGAPPALKPFLNRKSLSWCYACDRLTPTLKPALLEEIRDAFVALGPLYRYVMEM